MIKELDPSLLKRLIRAALKEDLGSGDVTSRYLVSKSQVAQARIVAKARGILAGVGVAEEVFALLDPEISFRSNLSDGDRLRPGDLIARLKGRVRPILAGERTALNFLQHLSGIATLTQKFVAEVSGVKVKILDTRKTLPGLRSLEKYAVRIGGGENHRYGLYDAILIKENHIRAAGGIKEAVHRAQSRNRRGLKLMVEVSDLEGLRIALDLGVDWVMLDNMGIEEIKAAVEINRGRAILEASGGINLQNVRKVAEAGVDYISIGMLTHSAPALDISLELDV
jgi:nicotinate-nucleotide pyrophosphorylase (carboxylating)